MVLVVGWGKGKKGRFIKERRENEVKDLGFSMRVRIRVLGLYRLLGRWGRVVLCVLVFYL